MLRSLVGSEMCIRDRQLATEANRIEYADSHLGKLFSKCPRPVRPNDNDAQGSTTENNAAEASNGEQKGDLAPMELNWPPLEVCRVMEQTGADEMFSGFATGVHNNLGMTCRTSLSGGSIERARAARNQQFAAHHENNFPRLAATFRGMAERMERMAIREDENSERMRLER